MTERFYIEKMDELYLKKGLAVTRWILSQHKKSQYAILVISQVQNRENKHRLKIDRTHEEIQIKQATPTKAF